MSRVLSASDICARALRAIGKFPTTESAPDGEDKREAMHWLDLILAETVGTNRMFSRVDKDTISFPITNGTGSYDFYATLGADTPTDRIQYIVDAWLEDDDGNRQPIEIVDRLKFEDVAKPDETGRPQWVYIDSDRETPNLRIWPTPASTDSTVYTIEMVVQLYAPNVAPGGVTGTQPRGAVLHNFGQAWQRWMIFQLAHDIGSGPVTKLPETSLTRFERQAAIARTRVEGFENRPHVTTDPICEPWGMDA